MTTGEKISRLRKENNYTQEQLAERMWGIKTIRKQMGIQYSISRNRKADTA